MIGALLLFTLISLVTFCIYVIKKRSFSNLVWFRAGLGVSAWCLFIFIMVESIIFVSHRNDFSALAQYTNEVRDLKEKFEQKTSELTFLISKHKEISEQEIEAINDVDIFFQQNPELKTADVKTVLKEYVETKKRKKMTERNIVEREERIKYRAASHWVLILPDSK